MSFWSNLKSNLFGGLFNTPILSGGARSLTNKITGAGLTGAEREANAFSANEAEKQRQWEQQMSNTSYQRQVADMMAAGINPAMAVGSSGASTPSGSSASSVSPNSGSSLSELLQLMAFKKEMQRADAEIQNTNADTGLKTAETGNVSARTDLLSPEFELKLRNMDNEERKTFLQEQSVLISSDLAQSEISKADVEVQSLLQHIQESKQNVRESESRVALNAASGALYRAEAYQIYELLPYLEAYKVASTNTERVQAGYLSVQKAYQQKLLSDGYVDAMVREAVASAETSEFHATSAQVDAYLDKLHYALRTGQYYPTDGDSVFGNNAAKVQNSVLRAFSTFADEMSPLIQPLATVGAAKVVASSRSK